MGHIFIGVAYIVFFVFSFCLACVVGTGFATYIRLIKGLSANPFWCSPQWLAINLVIIGSPLFVIGKYLQKNGDETVLLTLWLISYAIGFVLGWRAERIIYENPAVNQSQRHGVNSFQRQSSIANLQKNSTTSSHLSFLQQVLQLVGYSKGDPNVVYPMLAENLDKLDDNLVRALRNWRISRQEAAVIGNFSDLIQKFPLGDKAINLEIAIAGYEIIGRVFSREANPRNWAALQNGLGTAYANRVRGKRADNLEQAIQYYNQALQVFTYGSFPQYWADTQENLGSTYANRIRGERSNNLQRAIQYYQQALQVHSREEFPQKWAQIQNNLGNAYTDYIIGNRPENLEQAIKCFKGALEERERDTFPEQWAESQHNLGNAYRQRILGEKSENLEWAIKCYYQALQVFTRQAFPQDWAMTQNNLALAYIQRIRGLRVENLFKATQCLLNALEVRTRESFPEGYARAQRNLAVIYREFAYARAQRNLAFINIDNTDRKMMEKVWQESPERAFVCCQNALKVFTREAFPQAWADVQGTLAGAYMEAENLEEAITCCQNALKVFTREAFPQAWANIQDALAIAYIKKADTKKIEKERAENLDKAISHGRAALEVRTREAFPEDHAKTQYNLGHAYQDARQFHNAYNALAAAIDTAESIRSEILIGSGREEDKRKIAEESSIGHQRMVEVCLELAKEEPQYKNQAIEYVERNKTRNLIELILNRDWKTIFPSEVVTQLEKYRDEIAAAQYQLQNGKAENPTDLAQHLRELRQKWNDLQNRYLPVGSGYKFDQFQKNLDDHTAIVEFYNNITEDKFLTFIFTRQTQQPIVLPSEPKDLEKLENIVNEYLGSYHNKKSDWQNQLSKRIHLLAKILHIDEIIQQIPSECKRLILIPHRYLHLFPLHALPINSQQGEAKSEILMHRFPAGVSYAPSCQLLQMAQTRERSDFIQMFAIKNPTGDLIYANIEVETIKQYFNPADVLVENAATKTAIEKKLLSTFHCAHFSCHGYFNFNQPQKSALILADAYVSPAPDELNPEQHLVLDNGKVIDLDKCLTLDALFTPKFKLEQCRLVTLSACETGLIDPNNISDEYIGLPSGFLVAGSPAVVSSLWTVNDLSTALLMIKFYENLQQKQMSLAVALNQAQFWLRDLTQSQVLAWSQQLELKDSLMKGIKQRLAWYNPDEQPFQDPYYWAPFCAIGE